MTEERSLSIPETEAPASGPPLGPVDRPRTSLRTVARLYAILLALLLLAVGASVMFFVLQVRKQIAAAFEAVPPVVLALEARPQIEGLLLDAHRYGKTRDREKMEQALRTRLTNLRQTIQGIEEWLDEQQYHGDLAALLVKEYILLKDVEEAIVALLLDLRLNRWDSVQRLVNHLEGKQQALEALSKQVLDLGLTRHQTLLAQARKSLQLIVWVPGAFAGTMLVLTLLQALLFQRYLVQPILRVAQGVQAYMQGNWRFRLEEEARRPDEIGVLARVFNRMAEEVEKSRLFLEQQVQERTYALQRRMAQTHAAVDIGRAITMERDLERMLQTAVDLIAQRFGFYQVGVFLLDEAGQWVTLQAASSPSGKQLVERGFRLRVGEQGIVGYVAHTGQVRVVEDVTEDPFYLFVAEWQETRSEMALPLRVGDEIVGVLDIQSQKVHAFQPDDIATLRIVADLLAVAVYNARLFQRQREALQALERAQRLLTAQAWEQFVDRYLPRGYRFTGQALEPLLGAPGPREALERFSDDERVLRFPLLLRGQEVAVLELVRAEDGRKWSEREKDLAKTLAERLALALDHARLFMNSQRRLAWLHKVAEMARLWELKPVQELLRDLTEYMQSTFGWPHVVFYRWDEQQEALQVWGGRPKWTSLLELSQKDNLPTPARNALDKGTEYVAMRHPWTSNVEGTWALLPMYAGEKIVGLLEIGVDTPAAFTQEDLPVLRLLAEEVASALENARLFQLVQQLLEQHQNLHRLMMAVMQATSEDEAMRVTVDMLARLLPDTAVALYRYDENARILRLHHRSPAAQDAASVVALENTPYGRALKTGQPVWMNASPLSRNFFWEGHHSLFLLPLRYGETYLGMLVLQRREYDAFPPEERELYTTLGFLLSAVYHNLRLVSDLDRRTRELQLLYEFSESLARHTRQKELLDEAARRLREIFDSLHCGIALFDSTRQWSYLAATASRSPDAPGAELLGVRFPHQGDESIQRIKRTKEILTIYNVERALFLSRNIREILKQRGTQSLVIAPLLARGQVVGTVALDLDDPHRRLTREELQLLRQLVAQLSGALERVQLLETLTRRAEREHLVREITTRLRATTDPEEVLRIALAELRRALEAERVQILLVPNAHRPEDGR